MADYTLDKKQIEEIVKAELEFFGKISENTVSDIQSMIKNDIEAGLEISSFIKEMYENEAKLSDFVNNISLDVKETVESVNETIKETAEVSKKTSEDINESLNESLKTQNNAFKMMFGFFGDLSKELLTELYDIGRNAFGDKITNIFREEKEGLIDPIVSLYQGISSMQAFKNLKFNKAESENVSSEIGSMISSFVPETAAIPSFSDDAISILQSIDAKLALFSTYLLSDSIHNKLNDENINNTMSKGFSDLNDSNTTINMETSAQSSLLDEINASLNNMNKIDGQLYELEKEKFLVEQRERSKDKDSFITKLIKRMIASFAIGAVLGGIVSYLIIPFKLIYDTIKVIIPLVGKMEMGIKSLYTSFITFIKGFERAGESVTRFGRFIDKLKDLKGFKSIVLFFGSLKSIIMGTGDISRSIIRISRISSNLREYITGFNTIVLSIFRKLKDIIGIDRIITPIINMLSSFKGWITSFSSINSLLESIGSMFKTIIGPINRSVSVIKGIIRPFASVITTFASTLKTIFGAFTKFSPFRAGIITGLKFLGWPFTILMSVIDFVKGFFGSSEKTFLGRLKSGLTQMVVGFFEMPLRLLGWITEKVLGLFGIEAKGLGQKMVDKFKSLVKGVLDVILSPITLIAGAVTIGWRSITDMISESFAFLFGFVKNKGKGLFSALRLGFKEVFLLATIPFQIILGAINFFVGFFTSKEKTFLGKVKDGLTNIFVELARLPLRFVGWVIESIAGIFGIDSIGGIGIKGIGYKMIEIFRLFVKSLFTGIFDSIGDILNNFKEVFSSIIDYFGGIWKVVKGIFTLDWDTIKEGFGDINEAVSNILSNIINGIFNILFFIPKTILKAGDWIYSKLKEMAQGTIFESVFNLFDTIGGFIGKIIEWVKDKVKSIPIVGKLIKSDEEKRAAEIKEANEELTSINEERLKIREEISKQQKEIDAGDTRTGLGRSREKIILAKQEELAELDKQAKEQESIINQPSKSFDIETPKPSIPETAKVEPPKVQNPVFTIGTGDMSNIVKSGSTTLIYKYSKNQPYIWNKEDLTGFVKKLEKGENVPIGVSFIPKDEKHINPFSDTFAKLAVPKTKEISISPVESKKADLGISDTPSSIPSNVDQVESAKAQAITKQIKESKETKETISKMNESIKSQQEKPVVVNVDNGRDKNMFDPPVDIESMSILWLNKSYGLG